MFFLLQKTAAEGAKVVACEAQPGATDWHIQAESIESLTA